MRCRVLRTEGWGERNKLWIFWWNFNVYITWVVGLVNYASCPAFNKFHCRLWRGRKWINESNRYGSVLGAIFSSRWNGEDGKFGESFRVTWRIGASLLNNLERWNIDNFILGEPKDLRRCLIRWRSVFAIAIKIIIPFQLYFLYLNCFPFV
jgi:hypothetical protein